MEALARHRLGGRRRVAGFLILAAACALAAGGTRASAATQGILVSSSPARTLPALLDGTTVSGNAYVFVAGYSQARQVTFRLDSRSPVTRSSPFDYAGTTSSGSARPLNTTTLSEGAHRMTATVTGRGGARIAQLTATFAVHNGAPPPPPPPPPGGAGSILVPAYFYPGAAWTQMCSTLPAGSIAVMNPASGPGTATDPAYVDAVGPCRARGVHVIGYVYTSYGARSASAVRADIDAYFARYPVDGIFLDEMSNDVSTQAYYASLTQYVHAKGAGMTVVGNPGAAATSPWQVDGGAADVVNVFEGTASALSSWSPPAWVAARSASTLSAIVYAATSTSSMQSACARIASLNVGWAYATPDTLPNPFDTLPGDPYWSTEIASCG